MKCESFSEGFDENSIEFMEMKKPKTTKKRVRKVGVWSNDETKLLISEVRKRNFLWNHTLAEYHDRSKRLRAWDDISEVMERNGFDKSAFYCRTRWDVVRNSFRTAYQKMETVGSNKKHPFFDSLQFLLPIFKIKTTTNKSLCETPGNAFFEAEYNLQQSDIEESCSSNETDRQTPNQGFGKAPQTSKNSIQASIENALNVSYIDPFKETDETGALGNIVDTFVQEESKYLVKESCNERMQKISTNEADMLGNIVTSAVCGWPKKAINALRKDIFMLLAEKQQEINDGKYD